MAAFVRRLKASRETGFITPSQTFDIAIIFERSQKKHAYFWLYNAIWVHLNVSIGVANPDRHCFYAHALGFSQSSSTAHNCSTLIGLEIKPTMPQAMQLLRSVSVTPALRAIMGSVANFAC